MRRAANVSDFVEPPRDTGKSCTGCSLSWAASEQQETRLSRGKDWMNCGTGSAADQDDEADEQDEHRTGQAKGRSHRPGARNRILGLRTGF